MTTVVVKLGGAAITDKSKADTLSADLDMLVDNIGRVYQAELRPHGKRLVLIHGAGSFGHPPAKKFRVKAGWSTTTGSTAAAAANERDGNGDADGETAHEPSRPPSQHQQQEQQQQRREQEQKQEQEQQDRVKFGMALTRQRVLQLHHHVLQRLQHRAQLPVLSISTYDTVETSEGHLTAESSARLVRRVHKLLAQGFIPLLFGDAVIDLVWGCTILSGDALMHTLATALREVHRCVFVTDVPGIFTRDPKRFADATLIRELRCSSGREIPDDVHASGVDDVTGAMGSKWQWVKRIMTDAPHVCGVRICRASEADRALIIAEHYSHGDDSRSDDTNRWTSIVR
ncbi:hypothetical protein E4U21_000747 [Claviceps maximensis]|nr:hypothetical protein E4U21_000747 [Claviceps maximensis]